MARVVLVQRFLEPGEVRVLDRAAQILGLDGGEPVVRVDHQVDIVADGFAHGKDSGRVLAPAARTDDHCRGADRR
jgi:hypothetical protein